jgi:Pyruvate/2-oxoacid:ferredoxin oxidoreductase gamma subunit
MKNVSLEELEKRVFPSKFCEQMDEIQISANDIDIDIKAKRIRGRITNMTAAMLIIAITVIVTLHFDEVLAKLP